MKPRHLVLGASLLVAAAFAVFGDKTPSGEVVEAAPRNAARPPAAAPVSARPATAAIDSAGKAAPAPLVLALVPREQLMEEGGAADGAFAVHSWTPPPPPPPKPPPPPAPVAPPLPFTYLGKVQENGAWEVFLARGSETLIVKNQTVLDGVYRIDRIAPPSMTLTYLPLQQVQQMNIGVAE